jgi:hypothetical protein
MSRIAVVCIVFCLALWGINAATVANPTNQTPQGGEPSYAVDLWRPATQSTGFLDLSPIQLGNGKSTTLEIEVYARTASACILSMGDQGTDNFVALQLQDGNLVVRIGAVNQPNSVATSAGSPIKVNTWTTLSVVITNNDASTASVTAYANGAVIINGATTRALTTNTRKKVLIGRCQYNGGLGGGQGAQELNGIVDNFRVWDLARSVADIQAFATLISTTVDLDNPAGLIVHFPFVEGVGATSVGYAGQVANNYYVASFANDAVWVVKNAGNIHRTCSSAGDPHVAIHVPGQSTICFDPPHIVGQWQLTSCGNNFIVRTYHSPVRAWDLGEGCEAKVCGATINNAFTVRAFDDVFYVNVQGYFFIKKLYDTTFTALPVGTGVRASGTRYNIQSNKVFIEVPTAGYLNADILGLGRGGTYANIYIYHTLACETLGVSGLCANQDQRVTWNQFLFMDNVTPLPAPGEVPPRNFDPCDNLPEALRNVLKPQAETACASTIDQEKFPEAYADCIFDVCASGDITVATNINDDGSCRLAEILAAQTGQTTPACNTRAQCPNSCSGHGTCGTNGCQCNAGYVGPDCARPASFPCFNVQNGHELPLNPWVFQTSTIGTIADSDFFTFWNTWHTEDGILIYFAKVEASQSLYTYNLFVSNDAPNSDGGSYLLTITAPTAWYESAAAQGTGVNVQSTGVTTVVSFTWEAFRANGIIFKNVDTSALRTLTVQIESDTGIRQVSVGANSLRSELDVLAVDRSKSFVLTAGVCDDECAAETDCEVCAAKPQCGWCRSSGQCFLGGPSGPRAATCKDWKFSTDALVARRLTANFGYPVNPDTNTAYLPVNAVNDLDVDLFVSMGNKETIKWDMALVLGSSGNTNADDRTNWLVDFGSLPNVFRLFPDLGFSLGTYNSVNNNKFTLISALVDAASVTSDVLRSWVYGIQLADAYNDAATSALATLTNPSFGLNWRTNTRRMITIYVDQLPVFGTGLTPTAEELRQTLLNFRVLPVFLATSNVQAAWENVVNSELGFGLVIPVQADSGDLAFAITKAINLATSQISMITDLTSEGHVIDSFAQSVTGLSSNMRARFSVPFRANSAEAKTTTLIAPGFGAATVANVLNDSPLATIRNIKLTEDNFDNDYKFNGTVFRLAGLASNGVDPVLAEVVVAPVVGGLYQFDAAGPKPANLITAVPVLVNDPQGRVIYLAPPDASNNGDNQFDQFTYRVRDACAWSADVIVRVDVIGINDRPWTQMAAPIGDEDVPVELTFKFFDREGDSADAYISELPYDVLVTGEKVPRGKLYQYSAAVLAGNTVGATEIQAGDRVIDNRAVYIGWANSNTENKPVVLFSQPYLTYFVKETTCCKDNSCSQSECTLLTSWPETIQIFLRAVNDAPVIIKDSDLTNYNFTATPCFSDCTFLEDNGARYPDLAQPVQVWLGGGDIELDQLTAVITALELPAAASLTDLSGNQIAVGSVIGPFSAGSLKFDGVDWHPVGTLFPALRFTPGLDENNNVNGYYAKVTYKVNDGQKDSVDTKTVTIRITPVNDLPRSTIVTTYTGPIPTNQPGVLAVPHVITLMNTPANFSVTGTDPESDPVTPVLSSCFATGGKIEYLNNNVWVAVVCTQPTTLPTKPSGSTWLFRYTPPTNVAADSLQVVTYQLQDGSNDNQVGVDDWVVTIDVIAVNQAPTLQLDNNAPSSNLVLATSVGAGLPLNYNLTLADPDVESGTMLFSANLVCLETKTENCVGRIVVTDIASGTVITRTNTNIVIKGMIFDLQVVLRTFNFISTKMSRYALNVTINDNGNLGVCPPVPGANTIVRFCPLQANLNAVITVDDGSAINTIVIASVAGAAAAAGIALAAGFASRLNKKAQSAQYTPWEINDMDRGISNPLHESPTVEMSNPLHEGPESVNE